MKCKGKAKRGQRGEYGKERRKKEEGGDEAGFDGRAKEGWEVT